MILNFNDKDDIPNIKLYLKSKGIILSRKYLPNIDSFEQIYMVDSIEEWRRTYLYI